MRSVPLPLALFAAASTPLAAQGFGPLQTYAVPDIQNVTSGDLNGDGAPDIIACGLSLFSVLLGDGIGGFAAPVTYGTIPAGKQIVPVDIDRDGRLDVLVSSHAGGIFWPGDGSGAVAFSHNLGLPSGVGDTIADIDGDGRSDWVAPVAYNILIARGTQAWGFGTPVLVPVPTSAPLGPLCLARDVDGDGRIDLIAGDGPTTTIYVLFGDGAGGFTPPVTMPLALVANHFAVGDLDGDGDLDLVVARQAPQEVLILQNQAGRTFLAPVAIPLPGASSGIARVAVADTSGDGHADLVLTTYDETIVLHGDGAGGFSVSSVLPGGRYNLHIVDLNADGRLDIVSLGANGQVGVRLGLLTTQPGLGAFGTGTPTCLGTVGIAANRRPSIGSADFRLLVTNAPPAQDGFVGFGLADAGSLDPWGFGFLLHVQSGSVLATAMLRSDFFGAASYALPIPSYGGLIGHQLAVQSYWQGHAGLGNTCSPALYELASSRGLSITIQP